MCRRKTTEEFIAESKIVHGDRYDYSETLYVNGKTKVNIICREHGMFNQIPNCHTSNGSGCYDCGRKITENADRKGTTKSFIKSATKTHGGRYSYKKVNYYDRKTPVVITCKKHGDFLQKPKSHIAGYNCKKCGREKAIKNCKKERTVSELMEIALKYKTRKVFQTKDGAIYKYAQKRSLIDTICVHMEQGGFQSENNTIYIWEAVGEKWNDKKIYKIGVTSSKLADHRIKTVVSQFTFYANIIILKKVEGKATDIEKTLLDMGDIVNMGDVNGKKEFRALTDQELKKALDIIKATARPD